MKTQIICSALAATMAAAQRAPSMADLEAASQAYAAAGSAYLTAAKSVQQSVSEPAGGCVRDKTTGECVSFLQSFVQPIIARVMGADTESVGELERKTQSPAIFLHLHHSFLQDPVFPGAAAGASTTIAKSLAAAAGAQDRKGESALIQKAISQGSAQLATRAASDLNLAALRKDAYIATHFRVRKMLHTGGCPRDFSGCPVGFAAGGAGCEPTSYQGFCGARDFSSMSAAQKEDWSFKCGASFACA